MNAAFGHTCAPLNQKAFAKDGLAAHSAYPLLQQQQQSRTTTAAK